MARVLIVDDSPTEVHSLRAMLERNGFNVDSAANGEEGIEKAKSSHPDLILMDIVMPGMNGFQATRRLAKDAKTADIPVIIVSTKGQETDVVWGKRQGARDYVIKPINEQDLIQRVNTMLGST
ncbi:MAG: response regulator [Gammaproteobacteria bacterium]|jgi:Response regulator containing a CheY-like receiver domain and a GGDEF domain|nr:response regulator [Gammaproteobacteria bacterium]